jgi:Family of unknown function (DUF6178)
MGAPSLPPDETRRLLALARRDRGAAEKALAALSVDAQLALICETPLSQRGEMLALLSAPEAVIPLLPEAELCFIVKAVGLADAPWILEHASPEQVQACIDLDAWNAYEPDIAKLNDWLDALASSSVEAAVRSVRALDPELLVMFLRSRIAVVLKPAGDDDWQPPVGSQTLEGQFFFSALSEGDDLASTQTLLRALFEADYWTYFRMMQGAIWELDSDNQEYALRWRNGRLEDLGFPGWDEAIRIYGFLAPGERARVPEDAHPLDVSEWRLPVWMPVLPALRDRRHRIFDAIARLEEAERLACFYAFVAVANKVAVADRMPLSDALSTPRAIDKAAVWTSRGLAHVAAENGLDDTEVLRRVALERLFRVGANLDPTSARP